LLQMALCEVRFVPEVLAAVGAKRAQLGNIQSLLGDNVGFGRIA